MTFGKLLTYYTFTHNCHGFVARIEMTCIVRNERRFVLRHSAYRVAFWCGKFSKLTVELTLQIMPSFKVMCMFAVDLMKYCILLNHFAMP